MHRLGQRLGVAGALLDDPVDHLLGEQRVAAGALGDLLGELAAAGAASPSSARDQLARLLAARAARARSWSRCAARRPSRGGGRAARRGPGRAISTGPRAQRARYSIRSSIPSSAQWMSSTAKHQRLAPARRPRPACRTAEKRRSRICCGSSGSARAAGGRRRRLDPERAPERRGEPLGGLLASSSSSQLLDPAAELAPGGLGVVGVDDLEGARGRSRRAPSRRGRRRRRGSCRAGPPAAARARRRCAVSSRSSRDLPTPAWPITVTRCGRPLARPPARTATAAAPTRPRGRSAAVESPPARAARPRTTARTASQAGTGSDLPLSSSGSSSTYSIAARVSRWVISPTVTVPGLGRAPAAAPRR